MGLILSRANGDKIILRLARDFPAGTEIAIEVQEIRFNRAVLHFLAPAAVTILRSELLERKADVQNPELSAR